jgi:arylsulfatase A-like enzyme
MKNIMLIMLSILLGMSEISIAKELPNIVIIIADDIGYSDFGCYGGEIPTPNIDKIAAKGIRFTHYYSENMCAPSRAALLTGQYHIRGYNTGNNITMAEALSTAGYSTYAVGKWHNAGEQIQDRSAPQKRGFSHFFGTPIGCGSFFAPLMLTRDGEPAENEWESKDFYYTDAISENAIKYIRDTPKDKPFFLYTAYTAAHWPLHARQEDIDKHKGRYSAGWDQLRKQRLARMKELGVIKNDTPLSERDEQVPSWENAKHKEWEQRRMEVYAAQIEVMDKGIGRIIKELENSERLNNTLLMVLVDNGGCHVEYSKDRKGPFLNATTRDGKPVRAGNLPKIMPGPEDTWQSYGRGWANASNTPFRLFKQYDHEGGIRVPLIVQWPGVIKNGGQITHQTSHVIDLLPTVLDAAGVEYPEAYKGKPVDATDGKSFIPLLNGEKQINHDILFWQHSQGAAVLQNKWKLVRVKNKPWELYNLSVDPVEMNNLAKKHPERVDELSLLWEEWRKQK